MPEAKRKIKSLYVDWISLVEKPANKKPIILKSEDMDTANIPQYEKFLPILKTDQEKQIVYGLVAVPEEVDSQGDLYTVEAVEKSMEEFMQWGWTGAVDREHDFQQRPAFVRESWLVKEDDPMFEEAGSWAVGIKVNSSDLWELVKNGAVRGLSLAGRVEEAEEVKVSKDEKGIVAAIKNLLGVGTVEKAGKTISAATKDKLTMASEALLGASEAISELLNLDVEKSEGDDGMDENKINEIIKNSINEVLAPVVERIDAIEKSEVKAKPETAPEGTAEAEPERRVEDIVKSAVSDAIAPVTERLEKLEKSVIGSKGSSEDDLLKSSKSASTSWAGVPLL